MTSNTGFDVPAPATGPDVWYAADYETDSSWLHRLTDADIAEIEAAMAHAIGTGKPVIEMTRADFPLPTLATKIDAIVREVEEGRGFALLRGIRLPDYSHQEASVLFWGVGQYIGEPISQNPQGALLHTIEDLGNDYDGNNVRGHSSNRRLRPHVDPCDIVGLFCIHPAMTGGVSTIASASAIHNEILKTRPELLERLYRGYRIDYAGKGPSDAPNLTSPLRIPVYSNVDGRLTCYYNAKQVERGAKKTGDLYDALDNDAIMALEELSERPDLQFNMGFQTGDIQLLNNYTILHSRTDYEDWPDPARKRRLLRLWLNTPTARALLPEVADRLGTGPRGGVNPYLA